MRLAYLKAMLAAAVLLLAPTVSVAADVTVNGAPVPVAVAPVAAVVEEPIIIEQAVPLAPPPIVRYGCKRVWRCDPLVCEWRRGCWGTYGYMEGPYYTEPLAQRQWERHGWPVPPRYSQRYPSTVPSK